MRGGRDVANPGFGPQQPPCCSDVVRGIHADGHPDCIVHLHRFCFVDFDGVGDCNDVADVEHYSDADGDADAHPDADSVVHVDGDVVCDVIRERDEHELLYGDLQRDTDALCNFLEHPVFDVVENLDR